jgi:type I restriction enzyme S subunit
VRQVKRKVDPVVAGLERYVAGEHMDTDDLRIRRWGNVGDGYLGPAFTAHFLPGEVLYGSRRTYLRKVAVADFEGVCANTTFVLEPSTPELLPEYLPYVMSTDPFHEHSVKQSKGSVNPYINFRDLTWYEFALPPLEEQHRIVKVLNAVDEVHEAYLQAQLAAQILVLSLAARLVPVDKAKASGRLGDLCQVQVGFPFPSPDYVETGIRLLRCSNVSVAILTWEEESTRYWPEDKRHEYSDYELEVGDVVVAMDRPFVGKGFKISRVSKDDLPALLLQRVGRLLPKPGVTKDTLWSILRAPSTPRHLKSMQKGTDLPHISRFDIERIPIDMVAALDRDIHALIGAAEATVSATDLVIRSVGVLRKRLLGVLLNVH